MKKTLVIWQVAGFIFTGIIGGLFHFLYDWSGENIFVALVSAVNESIWEHIKLLFFPMFVFSVLENRYIGSMYKSFWCVKLIGIVVGMIMIPVLYYTINGVFGISFDWINIGIFFVVNAFSYFIETILLNLDNMKCKLDRKVLLVLGGIFLLFMILTFNPLHIPLFEDPTTNTYGYFKEKV